MPGEPPSFSRKAEELIAEFRGLPSADPPRMRRRPTTRVAPLIETLLVKYQIGRHSCEQTVRDAWPDIVGAANAAYSHPLQIDPGKTLVILVSHSVVRNELFMHRELILEKIRKLPGCDEIHDIRLRAG